MIPVLQKSKLVNRNSYITEFLLISNIDQRMMIYKVALHFKNLSDLLPAVSTQFH